MSAMSIAVVSMAAGTGNALADEVKVMLGGDKEVPPVTTMAKGAGTITVMDDKSVRGMITTSGLTGTMAHIHLGAVGVNGPVIIPLTKSGDGKWMVPDGATLTDEQYRAYQAGELYINVHTAEHKGGEIRGQLK
jgi:hypothetical protein